MYRQGRPGYHAIEGSDRGVARQVERQTRDQDELVDAELFPQEGETADIESGLCEFKRS